ncbi:MAG: hypothetical protein AAF541_07315 [Pseudomonadota bacterium]
MKIPHFEFWHPRLFEAPYYLYLLLGCLRYRLPPKHLAKANYALDHGELGLGSKFATQMAFDQAYFLPSILLTDGTPEEIERAMLFAEQHGWPVILKPDIGAVGKGIQKLHNAEEIKLAVSKLQSPSILQKFTPANFEYGVFYVRREDQGQITGINRKHFPTVVGNGKDNIDTLARAHYRYTSHWDLFLRYLDTSRVPEVQEVVQLSFVGSHTMGCKFTNDTHLASEKLLEAFDEICASQPGFNFGRFDVKADSEVAFQDGRFHVIEVNGIASLPTHMFDPDQSLIQAYRIFLSHGRHLLQVATEHRTQPMLLLGYQEIWQRAKDNYSLLNQIHADALEQKASDQDAP